MTCYECGCSITAQEKRKKSGNTYIYYHCTNGRGTCGKITYIREEKIESYFTEALSKIHLPADVVDGTKAALLESQKDERLFREAQITSLMTRHSNLQNKIERSHEDRLDAKITLDFGESRTARWKKEQEDIESKLIAVRSTNTAYLERGVKLMKLSRRAPELFKAATHDEKRKLLNQALSNPQIKNGSLCYDFRFPFSNFVGVSHLEKWRGGRDSNPRPSA